MLRKILNTLYNVSGALSALFMVAIAISILVQIIGRMMGKVVDATEFSGFCLSASTFLGLAYSLRHGAHVRVTVLLESISVKKQHFFELLSCFVAALFSAYAAWWAIQFTMESHEYGDISPGLIAAPMWIPQLGMCIGLILLTIAFIDDFVQLYRGRHASYQTEAHQMSE